MLVQLAVDQVEVRVCPRRHRPAIVARPARVRTWHTVELALQPHQRQVAASDLTDHNRGKVELLGELAPGDHLNTGLGLPANPGKAGGKP